MKNKTKTKTDTENGALVTREEKAVGKGKMAKGYQLYGEKWKQFLLVSTVWCMHK